LISDYLCFSSLFFLTLRTSRAGWIPKSGKNFGTLKPIGFELIKIYQDWWQNFWVKISPRSHRNEAIGDQIDQQGKRMSWSKVKQVGWVLSLNWQST